MRMRGLFGDLSRKYNEGLICRPKLGKQQDVEMKLRRRNRHIDIDHICKIAACRWPMIVPLTDED
jgi:hypothetical protein